MVSMTQEECQRLHGELQEQIDRRFDAVERVPKAVGWVLGIVATLATAGIAGGITLAVNNEGRISAVETKMSHTEKVLERIEGKLDRILLKP